MKSLQNVWLLRFVKILVLSICCLVHLVDTLVLTSKNGQTDFEVGSQASFTCAIVPYTGILNWYYDGKKVSGCTGFTCTDINDDQGAFQFQYNTTSFIFILNIPSVQIKYNGMTFACNDGTNNQSIAITVTGKPEKNDRLLPVISLVALFPIAVVLILIMTLYQPAPTYRWNCLPFYERSMTISAEPLMLNKIKLQWSNLWIRKDLTDFEAIIEGNMLDNNGGVLDTLKPKKLTRDQFKQLTCTYDQLALGTRYVFQIKVEKPKAKSLLKEVETYGIPDTMEIIRIEGEAKSSSEIVLWLKYKRLPKNVKYWLCRRKYLTFQDGSSNEMTVGDDKYELLKNDLKNSKHTVNELNHETRYVFFIEIKDSKDKPIWTSHAIKLQTFALELCRVSKNTTEALFSDRVHANALTNARLDFTIATLFCSTTEFGYRQCNVRDLKDYTMGGLQENVRYRYFLEVTIESKIYSSNIIQDDNLGFELRLESRTDTEVQFSAKWLLDDVRTPQTAVLFCLSNTGHNRQKTITDFRKCIVDNLQENTRYCYFLEANINDVIYSSNIIRDATLGKHPKLHKQSQF